MHLLCGTGSHGGVVLETIDFIYIGDLYYKAFDEVECGGRGSMSRSTVFVE